MPIIPIKKILIANRGEIAIRVMRTCREMGIATVAIYSDADVRSPHTQLADEAVRIGPPPASKSYLNTRSIVEAAYRTNSDAVHPGYGFLSENAEFAEACHHAGLVFIGPPAAAIRSMGLKSAARRLISNAGIPVVPGYHEHDQTLSTLRARALEIGLPVLIKASAGGGGKGMRIVRDADSFDESVAAAQRESDKAFGSRELIIEKFIENARHIEVQILGDSSGSFVHLLERECSVQRRHQKIIEETPSPALTPDLRRRICETAVEVGRAINYTNAGTVEFILASSGEFYFIEVNTRLQVEHPVTEMVTGYDLVRLQIEIAEGRPLPFTQKDVRPVGHAIEARLYAEDPRNDFAPSTGTIRGLDLPTAAKSVRIDAGIECGSEVAIYYDPLLAKVIASGRDRAVAARRLAHALRNIVVHGVNTNRDFLIRVVEHPTFAAAECHTESLSELLPELTPGVGEIDRRIAAAVVALFLHKQRQSDARVLPALPLGYRNNPYRDPVVNLRVDDDEIQISWRQTGTDDYDVQIQDWISSARVIGLACENRGRCAASSIRVAFDGNQRLYRLTEAGDAFFVELPAGTLTVKRLPRYPPPQSILDHLDASAPMPGLVSKILVREGQQVRVGDALVILEAMKMEQTLRAAADGVVERVLVKLGDVVAPGDVLVHIGASS